MFSGSTRRTRGEIYKEGLYLSNIYELPLLPRKHFQALVRKNILIVITSRTSFFYTTPPINNTTSFSRMSSDTDSIKALFKAYESALRASSTASVLPLYAPTGVFMAQSFPTAIGTAAIKAAYDKVFDTIVLAPTFSVHEIEVFEGGQWAFARTSSAGSTKIKATGQMVKEANQELFVLQKVDGGEWKFARYCFCTVLPPGGE